MIEAYKDTQKNRKMKKIHKIKIHKCAGNGQPLGTPTWSGPPVMALDGPNSDPLGAQGGQGVQ